MLKSDEIKQLGKRIKRERELLNISQVDFAEIGGVSRATQYLYECGDRVPSIQYLLNILKAGADLQRVLYDETSRRAHNDIIHISTKTHKEILNLVDTYARDEKGRLLDREYRDELTQQLCLSVSFQDEDEINWDQLKNSLAR